MSCTEKGGQHLFQGRPRGGPWEIFRFIKEHANQFSVERMCKVLKVSISGYYYWIKHPIGVRQLKTQQLLIQIQQVYDRSQSRYGSPRIADDLNESGVKVSRNRVARLMNKASLKSIIYKKYRVQTTDSKHDFPVANNLLNREFSADKPSQKWVSDITYIRTGEGWLYLTAISDLADRKVVGWALSDTLKAVDTSIAAFQMALKNRPLDSELLFHSDRGVQYACIEFRDELKNLPVVQSVSRKGNCWDNAVAESFFKTLKCEMVNHTYFATRTAARLATFEYIEGWYNGTGRPAPTETFGVELPHAQSTEILSLLFLNGRLKKSPLYYCRSNPASRLDGLRD